MCDKEKRKLKDSYDTPLFGTLAADSPIPKNKIREQPLEPALAYQPHNGRTDERGECKIKSGYFLSDLHGG